jgi:NADH-quinone oxidoreductase subunit M
LIITGSFFMNSWVGLFCSSGMVLSACYGLWLLNRLLFGNIKNYSIQEYKDLTRLEFCYLVPFAFLTLALGLYPEFVVFYIYF